MIRKIIEIDQNKCNGCGKCATACHEGAITMVNGKATLIRDDYCDGLGNCLPACPTDAISFVYREAAAYDQSAVDAHLGKTKSAPATQETFSNLGQWPVQIKLVPPNAPYFNGCDLLISATCAPFAFGSFHQTFMQDKITLVGCPKLDGVDYSEKLGEILTENEIRSITLVRMQVPCCGGLAMAVDAAIKKSGKSVPLQVVTLSIEGEIL